MSFELDSVFHTETMVKILHTQGQVYYATKLCEEIASQHPENQNVLLLLEGIRKGKIPEKVPAYQTQVLAEPDLPSSFEDDTTEPGITFEALEMKEEEQQQTQAVEVATFDIEKYKKLAVLNDLLMKVQGRKNEIH